MQIKSCQFIASYHQTNEIKNSAYGEYAFCGRSNVGKSSIINMLTGHKSLAHVSSTPGKTQAINYFLINNSWNLVDLPGYGYARLSKTEQTRLYNLIEGYLSASKRLRQLFILIDSRLPAQKIDLDFIIWACSHSIPYTIVFSKIDKLNKSQKQQVASNYSQAAFEAGVPFNNAILSSSHTGEGKQELLSYIENLQSDKI